ncbi:LamG-like jellyroll fold domain-containing protein [Archangium sp.]|uniref:LamG-like jellyroll fold domain-containing protein n=1 Tax=Archangium sp. TaxID=1872627 RepID=UPI00286C2D00|nr:LamG-like jellyroll fold domain-containing protein [Archangium sp.]
MSIAYLLQQFDAIGPMGPRASILIDQSFTGSTELINQFRAVLGTSSVSIDAVTAATVRGEASLELVGTSSLLGLADAQVRFLAHEREGQLLITLELTVPSGWSFGTLFPEAPAFMARLGLGACKLVFSSAASSDEKSGQELVPGLNFVGELYFTGDLLPIGSLLQHHTPTLISGPVNEFRFDSDPLAFTGIRLMGPMALGFSNLGPLKVKDAHLFIKSGLKASHRDKVISATQQPGIYLLVSAELGGRPLRMSGRYDSEGTQEELRLYGRFEDFALSGFSSLNQTLGVDGLEEEVPKDLPLPEGIALTELGVTLDFARHEVKALRVGVGAQTNWDLIPDVAKLQEVGLTLSVTNPFDKSRALSTTFSGLVAFQTFEVVAFVDLPSLDFGACLPKDRTLPLGDVIESLIPGETGLPELTITQLLMQASPQARSFALSAVMEDLLSIPVGATAFEVSNFSLLAQYSKAGGGTGTVSARLRMGEASVLLSGEARGGLTLSGTLENFELKKFWSLVTNGESLPDEVPDILFETLNVLVNTKTGAFSVMGNASVAWDHLGGAGALQTNAQFTLTRNVSGPEGSRSSAFSASLSLQGQGPVQVADGFSLEAFNLLFDYQPGGGWKLSGGMGASVFDTRLDLQAGYETTQATRKIKLRATASPAAKLIELEDVGAYFFSQFDLLLDRRSAADGKKKTFFELRLASTLELENVFTLGGYLGLSDTAEGRQALTFKPHPGSTAFHVDFPTGEGMGVKGELFEVGFVKESASAGWSFTGTTHIGFTGFPGGLGDMLPSKVTAKLVAGRKDVRLSALNVTDAIALSLPTVKGKSLGKATVQLTEVGVSFKPELGLVLEAGLGLPAELNTYLGAQLFRVYQKGNPTTLSRTRFTISGTGVAMQFLASPFAAANTVMINGETWFDVDFGQYGALSLKMPSFRYDGVSQYFEAGGGCKVTRPLALPLTPLKLFLEACGGKGMSDFFPDKLPIDGLSLVDDKGDLKIDDLATFLKKAGDVPSEVISALKRTDKVLDRLPDGFKSYLRLELPEHLEFKFGFSPAGRISLALLAPETPVRVLFPSVVASYVPMPGLTGIELRKISIGTLMAGTLFYGEIDAVIDQYDIPSLALSLLLPTDQDFPLPTSDQLQRRIILDDVFCVIPVSQGLPIPIPIFYDEIGFEYLGIEGLGLQAHVGFPKPQLDGAAAMALFKAFDSFFSDRKALLDPKTPPGGVDLGFVFHDEFLQAPEYLGGGVLGTKAKTVKVGAWKYVASMMNFGKTFSLNDCISAIPFENRVGSANYKFAFLNFDADWMLTTPAEFKAGAFQQLKLSASDCNDFMTVLPSVASTSGQGKKGNEEGLVAFVRGKADLELLRMEAAFGLAASGSMGFNTGFKLNGAIGVTELELSGAVMVNAPLATTTTAAPVAQVATTVSTAPVPKGSHGAKALSFNGKDTWVEIPAADSLVLPEYTVELWLKSSRQQNSEWIDVFGVDTRQGGGFGRNYFLALNAQHNFYHHRFTDASGGNAGAPDTSNGSVQRDRWQHVTITNDGVTAKTYIDGKEAASGPVTGKLVLFKQPLIIGKTIGIQGGEFWRGELAEIRIWKRARRASDIESGLREVLRGDEKDLVSLYRFDEDTGQRVIDLCGRNHGTVRNGRFVDSDLLMFEGLDFNGKDDFVTVPDSQSLRLGAYTAEVWVKPKVKPTQQPEWSGVFGKKGRNYALIINKAGFAHHRFHSAAGYNDGAPDTPRGSIAWNKWNHVAITNDGKVARTYVNGVKLAEGPVTGSLVIDNESIFIGRSPDQDSERFAGEISEIRLWSRVRSPEELSGNMYRRLDAKDASLVSLWRFSEAKGDTLVDACGRNPGRIHMEDAVVEPEKLRHDGLVLNGRGDFALIAKSDKFNTPQYTLEAWVRPDKDPTGSWQCIWAGTDKAPSLYVSNKGLVSHRFTSTEKSPSLSTTVPIVKAPALPGMKSPTPTGKSTPGSALPVLKSNTLNTDVDVVRMGEWNHIAVTNDGKTCTLFVNGVQKARGTVPGELRALPAGIFVGRGEDGNDPSWFRGGIDDLRYWSVVRTPEQLASGKDLPLTGQEAGLVACYTMDHTSGTQLVDSGPNKLHGTVRGGAWALAVAPAEPARAAIQIQGHTHLAVAGRKVMQGDLRLVDDQFWFSGQLDLFPKEWPLQVQGHVEGMLSKQRFYLSGETENSLFGLVLSQSRLYMSNEQLRLEGRWLGAYLMLDVSWDKNDPVFAGSVGFSASRSLQFGTIRIGGVKVADNFRLSLDIAADVSLVVSRKGLAGDVTARFKINGKGFDLRMGFDVAPSDFDQLFQWIQQKIIDAPEKYLAHLFSDAVEWLKNVGSGAIEFAKDSGEAIGAALSSAFKVTKEAATLLMKNAGYAAEQVGAALNKAYNQTAKQTAELLKGAGYVVEDVGRALQAAYNSSADAASSVLRQVGYGAEDVGKAMSKTFNKTGKELEGLLNSAGFSSKDVKGAMGKVGDWGKGAVDTAGNLGKSAGKAIGGLFS